MIVIFRNSEIKKSSSAGEYLKNIYVPRVEGRYTHNNMGTRGGPFYVMFLFLTFPLHLPIPLLPRTWYVHIAR